MYTPRAGTFEKGHSNFEGPTVIIFRPEVTLCGCRDVKVQELTDPLSVSRFGLAVRR